MGSPWLVAQGKGIRAWVGEGQPLSPSDSDGYFCTVWVTFAPVYMAGNRWVWISVTEKSDGPESVTLSRVQDVHSKHERRLRIALSC